MSEVTIATSSANKDASVFRTSDILQLSYSLKLRVNPIFVKIPLLYNICMFLFDNVRVDITNYYIILGLFYHNLQNV